MRGKSPAAFVERRAISLLAYCRLTVEPMMHSVTTQPVTVDGSSVGIVNYLFNVI